MSRSRRATLGAVLALLVAAACGDGGAGDSGDTGDRLVVVAEFSILADFAEAVGGDRVSVRTIVPVGGDPHAHEPTPGDAALLADADVVIENGLGLSPWLERLRTHVTGHVVTVSRAVADRVLLEDDGDPDPHMWMAPPFAIAYVEVIAEELAGIDPDGAGHYRERAAAYIERIEALDEELQSAFATIPAGHRRLVTPHDAYRYFAAHFGLEVAGTLVGISTEEEPSARRMRELVDLVRAESIPTIFIESTIPPRLIERVAAEAGVAVGGPLYGDSVGEPGSGAEDYLGMLRANAEAIVTGLGGTVPWD